ncbi:MAG TPA: hypothetical protein VL400_26110, partial [Polyangiaceae bacterium]|nr:hypothetical protein [Polyangiaceae bacterium]
QLGKILYKQKKNADAAIEIDKAVELGADRDPRPGWLIEAHFMLGDVYESVDKEKAIGHYSEFLRLAPPDHAYRRDAEAALARLKPQR